MGEAKEATSAELAAFVERIEREEESKAEIAENIKGIYAEMKGHGYDVKVVRKIVADRKLEREELKEQRTVYDVYSEALDMF